MLMQEHSANRPIYSVIIPTYNRGYILKDAIDSVLNQNFDGVEIVVIDDGSTDNTKELIETEYSNVVYLYQSNQGISAARNKGVSLASGQYIALLDSDDIFLPGKISREMALFQEFPDADVIAADAALFKNGVELELTYMMKRNFQFLKEGGYFLDINDMLWIMGSMFPVCSLVMHKRVLDKFDLSLYDTSFASSEDWDLEIRLINQCKILIDSAVTSHVRRFEDNTRAIRNLGLKGFQSTVFATILKNRILEKALDFGNWPDKTTNGIKEKIEEYNNQISQHFLENA